MAGSDRRIRYTKQVLKDSLFELMQETPVEQITVKELCARADIPGLHFMPTMIR